MRSGFENRPISLLSARLLCWEKNCRKSLKRAVCPMGRLALLETEEYAGLLQEFAGEIQITQVISPNVFDDIDIAFFTCSPEIMQAYVTSGARFPDLTIDLTQAGREGTVYLHGISDTRLLRTHGYFVNPHAATITIGRILSDLHNTFAVQSGTITLLQPASERGNAGVDELQEQTVNLLNFQQLQNKVFSGQLAFNVLAEPEISGQTELRIREQLELVLGKTVPKPAITVFRFRFFTHRLFRSWSSCWPRRRSDELSAHSRTPAGFRWTAPDQDLRRLQSPAATRFISGACGTQAVLVTHSGCRRQYQHRGLECGTDRRTNHACACPRSVVTPPER